MICIALIAFVVGFWFGMYTGFESVTRDIGRYGFFTWGGKKYDCTSDPAAKP